MWKEALEFLVELSRQRFVVREDEGGLAELFDDVCRGESFARPGDAEERLAILPREEPGRDFLYGGGLIAGGLKRTDEIEMDGHARVPLGADYSNASIFDANV